MYYVMGNNITEILLKVLLNTITLTSVMGVSVGTMFFINIALVLFDKSF